MPSFASPPPHAVQAVGSRYKWIALSNTTLGMLMATVNSSIMLIALPDIFRGIGVDPLQPGNTTLLLWLLMEYLVVTAVLVVSFGRLIWLQGIYLPIHGYSFEQTPLWAGIATSPI